MAASNKLYSWLEDKGKMPRLEEDLGETELPDLDEELPEEELSLPEETPEELVPEDEQDEISPDFAMALLRKRRFK